MGQPGNEEKQAQSLSLIHCDCDQLIIAGKQKFTIIMIVQNLMIATGMYVLYHLCYRESTY